MATIRDRPGTMECSGPFGISEAFSGMMEIPNCGLRHVNITQAYSTRPESAISERIPAGPRWVKPGKHKLDPHVIKQHLM